MIIPADYHHNLLLMRGEPHTWTKDSVRRLKIIAWMIGENGMSLPITACPLMHRGPQYIIEDVESGFISAFDLSTQSVWVADDVTAWVVLVKDMKLSMTTPVGTA